MMYIKLFESFESTNLSKTLGYVRKSDRTLLINSLKSVTTEADVPFSKISDDFIEYLPFYKAYNKTIPNKTLIKFWFDLNGRYLKATLSDRTITKTVKYDEKNANHLDKVYFKLIGDGFLFFGDDDHIYFLHNNDNYKTTADVTIPPGDEWKKYGKYSTIIGNMGKIYVDLYQNKRVAENSGVYFYTSSIRQGGHLDEKELGDASFALVLNVTDLKKSVTPLSSIKSDRKELKSGLNLTDDEIRKANINRYLNKLSDDFNFELGDLNDINKAVLKLCGGKYILFHIYNYVPRELNSLGSDIYGLIEGRFTSPKVIKATYKRGYENARNKNLLLLNNINNVKSHGEFFSIDLIEKTMKVSKQLYRKIQGFGNITNIEELDVLISKIDSISNFMRNNRYGLLVSHIRLFVLNEEYWKHFIGIQDYDVIEKAMKDLDVVSNFIKKI